MFLEDSVVYFDQQIDFLKAFFCFSCKNKMREIDIKFKFFWKFFEKFWDMFGSFWKFFGEF